MSLENHYQGLNILITGGLGFLGSNLAQRLVELGSQVTIIDNFQPDHGANWRNIHGIKEKVKVRVSDIRDASVMDELVKDKDIIFHIAGQTSHTDSMKDPFPDIDINCRGTMVFLESVRRINPRARIVLASTRAVYGAPEVVPARESACPNPADIYSVDKLAGEGYCAIYHRVHGIPVVILRLSNGYGPRAQIRLPKYGILNWFVGLVLEGRKIRVFGDGSQLRDYVFVDDITEAFLLSGQKPGAVGKIFNVGGSKQVRFVDMVKTLIKTAGRGEFELVPWPEDYKKIEVGDFASDCTLIEKELGWKPGVDLEKGLGITFDFYENNREFYLPKDIGVNGTL